MISDDEPMTLAEACETLFRGHIKPATLRAEAARGRLVIERIGRRDFVTRRAIKEMRKQCQVTSGNQNESQNEFEPSRAEAANAAAYASARALRAKTNQ